jgi:hypothetical protein
MPCLTGFAGYDSGQLPATVTGCVPWIGGLAWAGRTAERLTATGAGRGKAG